MNEARTVLVIEDERAILKLLRDVLEDEHLVVREATTGRMGLVEAASRRPDLVVLDLGLPDMDGKDVLRDLRNWSDIPVLVLSARGAEEEKVVALDLGADDYLVKPFGVPELMARLRALLRRREGATAAKGPVYKFGDATVDMVTRFVTKAGVEIHVTPVEFRLLSELLRAEGRIVTQRHLLREVWGPGHEANTHYLRIYMGHLRRKLEDDPARPRHLLTETGVGCRCLCERAEEP
ncbi:MAG: operon transcriptional regulatory protein KdpE [Fibrobacterota bacterium]|jgi:two-component system KDP operon response regulator KdpE